MYEIFALLLITVLIIYPEMSYCLITVFLCVLSGWSSFGTDITPLVKKCPQLLRSPKVLPANGLCPQSGECASAHHLSLEIAVTI